MSSACWPVGARDPDADAARADFAGNIEFCQRGDDPPFQLSHETAHIAAALAHVEHDVDHALTGAMIGILPAAFRFIDGKAVRVG